MEPVNQTDDDKTIDLLSKGIMELYEPPLATINTHLKELTERQEAVHSMLTSERRKLEDLQNDAMVDALLRAANVEKAAKYKAAQNNPSSS